MHLYSQECQIVGTYQRNCSFTADHLHAGNLFKMKSGNREMDPLQYILDFTLSSFCVSSLCTGGHPVRRRDPVRFAQARVAGGPPASEETQD